MSLDRQAAKVDRKEVVPCLLFSLVFDFCFFAVVLFCSLWCVRGLWKIGESMSPKGANNYIESFDTTSDSKDRERDIWRLRAARLDARLEHWRPQQEFGVVQD